MIEIEVTGVDDFLAGLDRLDSLLDDVVQDSETFAARTTVSLARPEVPVVTGAAAASLRVVDYNDGAAATGGNGAVPYYAWLEYGGYAGIRQSVYRPVVAQGRYLRPAYLHAQSQILAEMIDLLTEATRRAGLS